jgi:hypothetical protein
MAFVTGRKARLGSASDALDQLVDQLAAARARHDAVAEKRRANFAREVAALRSELREAYALLERLRTINAFTAYQRMESDAINSTGVAEVMVELVRDTYHSKYVDVAFAVAPVLEVRRHVGEVTATAAGAGHPLHCIVVGGGAPPTGHGSA